MTTPTKQLDCEHKWVIKGPLEYGAIRSCKRCKARSRLERGFSDDSGPANMTQALGLASFVWRKLEDEPSR